MKSLLATALLTSCVASTPTHSVLPTSIVGEWISGKFEFTDDNAEPQMGTFIWLFPDGRAAWFVAPYIGAPCAVSYDANAHTLVLRDTYKHHPEEPVTVLYLSYDQKEQTLILTKVDPPNDESASQKQPTMKFKRRRASLPAFIRKGYGLP